jgi:hypothetical protein
MKLKSNIKLTFRDLRIAEKFIFKGSLFEKKTRRTAKHTINGQVLFFKHDNDFISRWYC